MKVGFIGAGKMAEAMIASLLEANVLAPEDVVASDVSEERRTGLNQQYGIAMYPTSRGIPDLAEILVLAVKPQQLGEVLADIAPAVTSRHLVVSIAAGRRIAAIEAVLPQARVIRVMPNLPCQVAEGMSVYCAGARATRDDRDVAGRLLGSFGRVMELPESLFDAVTAVSGSGPAFFAYFLDALAEAGVSQGLKRSDALLLAEQTMLGTAKVLLEKKTDPRDLITAVTSAKGTTAAGLAVLDASPLKDIVSETIAAAARRSQELSA